MPRVHAQKARTDIYAKGKMIKDPKTKSGKRLDRSMPADKQDRIIVKKGQTYYWWQFRYGGKHISTTPPKQSQLTQSEFLGTLYGIEEDYVESIASAETMEDLTSAVDAAKDALETLRDEQEEKKSNMPESLQEGPTGELLQERYDGCDNIITELENLSISDEEDAEEGEFEDKKSECEQIDFSV